MSSFPIAQSRPTVGSEEIKAVEAVLKSGQLAMGGKVRILENRFKKFIGIPYALAVNSGTSALHLALSALGAKDGREVIVPSYTCSALINAVRYTGAKTVIADIDTESMCISVEDVSDKVNSRTAAIIAVHTFGMPARIRALSSLGPAVVEDCAHSLGGVTADGKMGALGRCAIFSFYVTKMMTTGEGGMVATSSKRLAGMIKDMRAYDARPRYRVRYNYKMSDISGALGIAQLVKLKGFIERRRAIAKRYDYFFRRYDDIAVPKRCRVKDVYYRYFVLMKDRKSARGFIEKMNRTGIFCDSPITKPLHRYFDMPDKRFPGTVNIFNRAVSIPIYPSLTDTGIDRILSACSKVLKGRYA